MTLHETIAIYACAIFTVGSTSPLHHSTAETRVQEMHGHRCQCVVASIAAFVVIGLVGALVSKWTSATETRRIKLCNSLACDKYAQHILLQVNRSLDPCKDFSKYACSAWNPPWTRADYATSSITQLIRAWFDGFGVRLLNASKHGFAVADGPAAMLRACLMHTTKAGVPGIRELRELMASVHLNWPDPPDDDASPLGVLLRLAYSFGVRTWFTVRVYWRNSSHIRTVHLSAADTISFAVKHHRRVTTSKAYELLWEAFYYRFQQFGNGSTSPKYAAIGISAVMQTFVVEHIFQAKTKATGGPACFPMSALDKYTANISSEEWVTEMDKVIPRAHVTASDNISVSDLAVLEAIDAIFKSFTRHDILDLLGWQLPQLYGPLVDPVLRKAYFGDEEHTAIYLPYVCASQVEASYPGLPAALHYLTRLDHSARNAVRMTLERVATTMADLVEGVSWLDEAKKVAASAKLRRVKVRLWPPLWMLEKEALTRIYSHFPVNATSLVDFLKLSRRTLRKLIESEPEFEEVLSSPLSDSLPYFSYDQALNEVSISAGAVQFPLFVPGGTAVMNYAGLGFSFALQLVRSLDSLSRTVTTERRCTDTDDDTFSSLTSALPQRSTCLAPVYNGSFFSEAVALEATHAAFVNTVSGAHDDGRLDKELSNEQIFYIALCYFQCGRQGGPHSFFIGCNKAVMHFPDFADAFRCPVGSRMHPSGSCGLF
ncbi:membrane metallo-endopeptidase-like 1 [Dermacentor silvarum]|uniref:membrane metallo-endopeptidase-like 1 n=1 Tax=Dermacentor silvarum TaxID=543639 RepID=UPI0021016D65|nr:membrane metallo-endopeptidase-like 1 [Dermacentor silvarum]